MAGSALIGGVVLASGQSSMWRDMFTFQIPPAEKVIRTVVVYLFIGVLIRVAGKRMMAQLNSFDLVVVLLLSNVVQNAIIGPDNSLSGGLLGAAVLVLFNALMDRVALLGPRSTWLFQGSPTVLVTHGKVDEKAVHRVGLRDHEIMSALHHQGADGPNEVRRAALEPGGTWNIELMRDEQAASLGDLRQAVIDLQRHIDARLSALERGDGRPLGGEGIS